MSELPLPEDADWMFDSLVNHFGFKDRNDKGWWTSLIEQVGDAYIREPILIGDWEVTKLYLGEDYDVVTPAGNYQSVVYKFTNGLNIRYLEIRGYCVSHDGCYWNDYGEVFPRTYTVNTYEGI